MKIYSNRTNKCLIGETYKIFIYNILLDYMYIYIYIIVWITLFIIIIIT